MGRQRAIALVLASAGTLLLLLTWSSRSPTPGRRCADGGLLWLSSEGIASCEPGQQLPAGQAMTLGQKFDCNTATQADFALIPGVGGQLAAELVAARDGGFVSWDQVDAIKGVGPARLEALQAACDILISDAGVW